jgi:Zn finger protein HypA/HybF involved in hydrogenase expression
MDFGRAKIMHDFLLAKEIIDELKIISREKKLGKVKSVDIEIGQVVLAHDGYEEHAEDISLENLNFGLQNIAKNTDFKEVKFNIKKVAGENWKITNIEVE